MAMFKVVTRVIQISLLAGYLLLLWLVANSVVVLNHDDGISYIAAAGNLGMYNQAGFSTWVEAREWQSYWTDIDSVSYSDIANGLAHYDIHPPLYFWLLHDWVEMNGVSAAAGPLMNLVFYVISAAAIFIACRLIRVSMLASLLATSLYFFSYFNISLLVEARQYALLAVLASVFVCALMRFIDKPVWQNALLISTSMLAGMLTHYYFAITLMMPVILWVFIYAFRRSYRSILPVFAGSIILAIAGFHFFYPDFYENFVRQQHQSQHFSLASLVKRIWVLAKTVVFVYWPILVGLSAYLYFAKKEILSAISRLEVQGVVRQLLDVENLPAVIGLCAIFMASGLYLFHVSPVHAMGAKYLAMGTVLVFAGFGRLLDVLFIKAHYGAQIVTATVLLQLILSAYGYGKYIERQSNMLASMQWSNGMGGAPILVDSTRRGILPRVLFHVSPNRKVFAKNQSEFAAALNESMLDGYESIIYVSDLSYESSEDGRKAVLNQLSGYGYVKILEKGNFYGVGTAYLASRK